MAVIWITGLSGSGKTTLSKLLIKELKAQSKNCIHIDGDEIRSVLSADARGAFNVERQDRVELGLRYSKLSNLLSKQGHIVVVSTISLFREVHQWNRANIHDYIEIYLKIPLEELFKRDPKHIYKDFHSGKTKNVAGLDLDVDLPEQPDFVLKYEDEPPSQSIKKLLKFLRYHQNENKMGLH